MKFDPWHYGTWEGARDGVREENLKLSLAEKIQILEGMEQLAVRIHRQRLREGLPVDPKIAALLEERMVAEDQAPYQSGPTPASPQP
jgi:hypothetical protein